MFILYFVLHFNSSKFTYVCFTRRVTRKEEGQLMGRMEERKRSVDGGGGGEERKWSVDGGGEGGG